MRLRLDCTLSSLESRMYWFLGRHIHAVWPGIVYILSSVSKRSVKSISARINITLLTLLGKVSFFFFGQVYFIVRGT